MCESLNLESLRLSRDTQSMIGGQVVRQSGQTVRSDGQYDH